MNRSIDKVSTSDVGKANGVCPLDANKKIPSAHLPTSSGSSSSDSSLLVNNKIPLKYIPQGEGSGLNSDKIQGYGPDHFATADTNIVCQYPLQGGGTLSSDSITIGLAEDVLNESFDHDKLKNIGTHSHTEIDGFIALASESPRAGALPLADGAGKLNAWVDMPMIDDFFEFDESGGLMPTITPTTSATWELDGNGGLQPKAAA